MKCCLLYLVILSQVLPWWVQKVEPFLYNFVVVVYFRDGRVCSGALYHQDVALVPTSCIGSQMSQARVELFRYNLTKPFNMDVPTQSGNSTSHHQAHTTHILAIHYINDITCLYLALKTTAKEGIKIGMISEEVPCFLMGWGENTSNQVLSQTSAPVLWKGYSSIKSSWLDLHRTIREPTNFYHGIELMKGSPLVYFSSNGPVLFGLVEDQYRTPTGLSEAKVIPLLLYQPSIEAAIRGIFQTTLVPLF